MILVDFKGSQDLHRVGAKSVKACADADEDRKWSDWQQTQRKDILGVLPVGDVAYSCEGHKQHHCEDDGLLQDDRVSIFVQALCPDIHDDSIAFEDEHGDSDVAEHPRNVEPCNWLMRLLISCKEVNAESEHAEHTY